MVSLTHQQASSSIKVNSPEKPTRQPLFGGDIDGVWQLEKQTLNDPNLFAHSQTSLIPIRQAPSKYCINTASGRHAAASSFSKTCRSLYTRPVSTYLPKSVKKTSSLLCGGAAHGVLLRATVLSRRWAQQCENVDG